VTQEHENSTSMENPISGDAIRRRFLHFFASRGHKILPSSSLVPDDPTVFLTIAGMLQFKPIFLGKVYLGQVCFIGRWLTIFVMFGFMVFLARQPIHFFPPCLPFPSQISKCQSW
jgi:tRNA synthetases class II (A)